MKSLNASVARATMMIVLSAFSFGSISVLTTLVTTAGVSLVTAMAWRYVLGAVFLAPISRVRQLRTVPAKRIVQLLLVGGLGQALITYVSLRALDFIPVGPLAFLFYTYPAWVAALAAIRRTEKLTPVRVTALIVALAGVAIMIGSPAEKALNPTGVVLALASAVLYAFYLPGLEYVQQGIPALFATFLLAGGAAIAFVLAAFLRGDVTLPPRWDVWTNIVVLALVSTVVAFATLIKGLSVLGPVRTSIIATVEPFFTAILGVVVLRNQFTAATLVGGVMIGAAILMIEWSSVHGAPVSPGVSFVSRLRSQDSAGHLD